MRQFSIALMLVLALVACGDKDEKSETKSATPTPTLSVITNFTGPILNTGGIESGEACEEADPNDPDAACGVPGITDVEDASSNAPLPLTEQTAFGLTIGIPDGFAPLELNNRLVISASDTAATPGEFTVIIRRVTAEELADYLTQIADLDATKQFDRENADNSLTGYVIPYGERGEVAVFGLADGQSLFINGFAAPGFWNTYSATFESMLDSLSLASN